MPNDHFKNAADKPFALSEDDRTRIDTTLEQYLHMDADSRVALIHDIEMTGTFRKIGYGSLIGDQDSETDDQFGGVVKGWEKGAFCKDRAYRGTPENLGATMGALPTEDGAGELPGVVLEINAGENDDIEFADRIIKSIKDFAYRETGPNPIYAYPVVDVETKRYGTVKAIICAADSENPLYLGRDGEQLTMEEKAAIIATSIGDQDENGQYYSPRNTGMAYWRDHVQCCKLGGFAVDEKIEQLIQLAEIYRAQLKTDNPQLFETLTSLESKNSATGSAQTYAEPVYDVDTLSASDDPRRILELRKSAVKIANLNTDPLTAEQVAANDRMKQDLKMDLGL